MKSNKLAIATLLAVSTLFAHAVETKFKPLRESDPLSSKNLTSITYGSDRCAALYITLDTIGTQVFKKKETPYAEAAEIMFTVAVLSDIEHSNSLKNPRYKTQGDAIKVHQKIVEKMTGGYVNELGKNKAKTGNIFSEAFMDDARYCNKFLKVVEDKIDSGNKYDI